MIKGKHYSARQTDFCLAELHIENDSVQLYSQGNVQISALYNQLNISDRIGNVSRKVVFPDGSVFETSNNDAIDHLIKDNASSLGFMAFVHVLERNMAMIFVSLFITAAVVFSGIKWGVPAAGHIIAANLPAATNKALSTNILSFMDEHLFTPSQLDEKKQQQIRQHYTNSLIPLYEGQQATEFKLHFRLWGDDKQHSIANALALPSGDIIVTDRFIELAESQDEIDMVLLHEMGHVVKRHSLEQVIEGTMLAVVVSLAFGDLSAIADTGIGVGAFLISSFYSRNHEIEADQFAYQYGLKAGIDPNKLTTILQKMELDMKLQLCSETPEKEANCLTDSTTLSGYFSSHPNSLERANKAKHFHDCFIQGLKHCP